MKLRFVFVAFLIPCPLGLSLVFAGKPSLHAQPASVTCNVCLTCQYWPGKTLAGLTTVSVPNFTGSLTNTIARYRVLASNIGGDHIDVGYCFGCNLTVGNVMCNANSGKYFYSDVTRNFAATFAFTPADKGHSVATGASSDGIGRINFCIHKTSSRVNPVNPVNTVR